MPLATGKTGYFKQIAYQPVFRWQLGTADIYNGNRFSPEKLDFLDICLSKSKVDHCKCMAVCLEMINHVHGQLFSTSCREW